MGGVRFSVSKKIIIGLVLSTLLFSVWANAEVSKDERVAVVVIELSNVASGTRKVFYQGLERLARSKTPWWLQDSYSEVHVLYQEQASFQLFYQTLWEAAQLENVRAIDVFLHLHGRQGAITFHDGAVGTWYVREKLKNVPSVGKKLRALYSTACFGASQAQDWLDGGFKVVNGALKVNANGAYELPAFLKSWTEGESFGAAQDKGNQQSWRSFYDNIAQKLMSEEVDSYKEVHGNASITIDSVP
ncbi:MAG: hypothetical protein HY537_08210 [Deltaproteobacteria bacterium]|nr:hypothetical protein [Deltaproteobacteria bacterium]